MLQLVQDVYNSGTSCTENSLPDKHSHMLNILLLKASFPSCSHIHSHRRKQWAIVSEGVQASGEQKPSRVTSDLWWLRVADWHEGLWEAFRWVRGLLKDHCVHCVQGLLCLCSISWLAVISDEQQTCYLRLFQHTKTLWSPRLVVILF